MGYSETFAKRLKQYLVEKEISAAELCRRLHISQSTIGKYLKGEGGVALSRLDKIEQELKLEEGWLLRPAGKNAAITQDEITVPFYNRVEDAFADTVEPDSSIRLDPTMFGRTPLFAGIVTSDTMEPTVNAGDIAVFGSAMSDANVIYQGTYCIKAGKSVLLGRPLDTGGDTVSVVFENKDYPTLNVTTDEVEIMYRVIGCIRRL